MNVRLCCQIMLNTVRFLLMRIIYGKRFSSSLIQRISVLSSVELHKHGSLKLGHNLFVGPGSSLLVTGSGSLEIGDRSYFNRGCMIICHQILHLH